MPEPASVRAARTPLAQAHERLGARMVEFAGWWMPIQYSGIIDEHRAVRERAGIFDLSHMGELYLEGPRAAEALNGLVSCDVRDMEPGQARYGVMCLPAGGIIDDLVIYREAPDRFMLVVNAARREADRAWIEQHVAGESVVFTDRSDDVALVAVQGPAAQALLEPLAGSIDLEPVGFYRFARGRIAGIDALVSRTGYTGEDGFEIFVEAGQAQRLWDALMDRGTTVGAAPVGLGARDTLRLEARYPLYGHDIDETTSPIEAGLAWTVSFEKGDFVGCHSLLEQRQRGPLRRLVGFVLDEKGVPRQSYRLLDQSGRPVGQVTSGTVSPTLGEPIGMGYVPVALAKADSVIQVEVRGRALRGHVVKGSFVPIRTRARKAGSPQSP